MVVPAPGGRKLELMRWGLVPFWTAPERVGSGWINARSESADGKPAFKESFARRRCLIPSDGFYEWIKGPPKRPVHFHLRDRGLFAFAGLWDRWRDPEGETLLSCTILTTKSNRLVAEVHDRMPAMLGRDDFTAWLNSETTIDSAKSLLKPYPSHLLEALEVGRFVSSPFNEGPQCLEPASQTPSERQRSLF